MKRYSVNRWLKYIENLSSLQNKSFLKPGDRF